jgi:hypothetical protein
MATAQQFGKIMAEVVNSNPGYDGLKKKAIYVPHEDKIYHGFEWSDTDKAVHANNVQWHKDNGELRETDIREWSHYNLHLPPTAAMWLEEQPEWINGTAKERRKFCDKLVATEPVFKAAKRL